MDSRANRLLVCAALWAISAFCHAQTHLVLCSDGFGSFSSKFRTGVTVTVGAPKVGGFSRHTCEATLSWGNDVMPVAQESWQVDIDVMGAELGLNTSVVAFQIKGSALDHLTTYKVYSLEKSPRLLRTITGGGFFSAGDTNLEGRTEIWTDDAGAVDGFEGLPLSSYDFAPTVVLRFEKQQLIEVSSEYQPYFDQRIAQLKTQLEARALAEFQNSDGSLQRILPLSNDEFHSLQTTKIKVLEIVWSYLYSGREEEAWRELSAMWPPADFNRIRGSILDAQARGIRRQVDGVSTPGSGLRWKHRAHIYNTVPESKGTAEMARGQDTAFETAIAPNLDSINAGLGEGRSPSVDAKPEPIYLGTPHSQVDNQPKVTSEVLLYLVIDAAGKVRSAQLANEADKGPIGDMLIGATTDWKFIPAFKNGRAVACRIRFSVSPYR